MTEHLLPLCKLPRCRTWDSEPRPLHLGCRRYEDLRHAHKNVDLSKHRVKITLQVNGYRERCCRCLTEHKTWSTWFSKNIRIYAQIATSQANFSPTFPWFLIKQDTQTTILLKSWNFPWNSLEISCFCPTLQLETHLKTPFEWGLYMLYIFVNLLRRWTWFLSKIQLL